MCLPRRVPMMEIKKFGRPYRVNVIMDTTTNWANVDTTMSTFQAAYTSVWIAENMVEQDTEGPQYVSFPRSIYNTFQEKVCKMTMVVWCSISRSSLSLLYISMAPVLEKIFKSEPHLAWWAFHTTSCNKSLSHDPSRPEVCGCRFPAKPLSGTAAPSFCRDEARAVSAARSVLKVTSIDWPFSPP